MSYPIDLDEVAFVEGAMEGRGQCSLRELRERWFSNYEEALDLARTPEFRTKEMNISAQKLADGKELTGTEKHNILGRAWAVAQMHDSMELKDANVEPFELVTDEELDKLIQLKSRRPRGEPGTPSPTTRNQKGTYVEEGGEHERRRDHDILEGNRQGLLPQTYENNDRECTGKKGSIQETGIGLRVGDGA